MTKISRFSVYFFSNFNFHARSHYLTSEVKGSLQLGQRSPNNRITTITLLESRICLLHITKNVLSVTILRLRRQQVAGYKKSVRSKIFISCGCRHCGNLHGKINYFENFLIVVFINHQYYFSKFVQKYQGSYVQAILSILRVA